MSNIENEAKLSVAPQALSRIRRERIAVLMDLVIGLILDSETKKEKIEWQEIYLQIRQVGLKYQPSGASVVEPDEFYKILAAKTSSGYTFLEAFQEKQLRRILFRRRIDG